MDNNTFASLVELDGQGATGKHKLTQEQNTHERDKKKQDPVPGARRPPPHGKGPGPYGWLPVNGISLFLKNMRQAQTAKNLKRDR